MKIISVLQMQNQLHNARMKELEALNQRKMTTISRRSTMRRYSTTFTKRLEQRKSTVNQQSIAQNVIALKQDDSNMLLNAKDIKILPEIQEINFHRINRAVNSKLATMLDSDNNSLSPPKPVSVKYAHRIHPERSESPSLTQDGNNSIEEVDFSNTISIITAKSLTSPAPPKKNSSSLNNSPSKKEKTQLQNIQQNKNVFQSIDQNTNSENIFRERDHQVVSELWAPMASMFTAEVIRREAQDKLLLAQLDAGLLPESFIKKPKPINENGEPIEGEEGELDGVVINLSKYGIGDERGLCLGKW